MSLKIIRRGQIWKVDLEPARGSEMKKSRPCVVVSADGLARLPVSIVVPLTDPDGKKKAIYHIPVAVADSESFFKAAGLSKDSVADVLQMRCVSHERFVEQLGTMVADRMVEIAAAIAVVVDYQPLDEPTTP